MTTPEAGALMRRQAGVISRTPVPDVGLTDRQVQRLVHIGRWTRLLPGVYVSAETSLTWRTWAHAALLAAGPGAVLVGETAVALRELVPTTLPITVAIPPGASAVGARRRGRAASGWCALTSPRTSA